jgi:hypothetical protein
VQTPDFNNDPIRNFYGAHGVLQHMTTKAVFISVLIFVLVTTVGGQESTVASRSANTRYFPAGVFDIDRTTSRETWYSNTLRALHEPSIFALRDDKSLQVYRFLWLPSFQLPISVRLTVNRGGSGSIVARSVDTHTGLVGKVPSDTGRLNLDKNVVVEKAEVDVVLRELEAFSFWSMPTEERQFGLDGSQWILEGVRQGEYQVVDRWSPEQGAYSAVCKHLIRLAGVETKLY